MHLTAAQGNEFYVKGVCKEALIRWSLQTPGLQLEGLWVEIRYWSLGSVLQKLLFVFSHHIYDNLLQRNRKLIYIWMYFPIFNIYGKIWVTWTNKQLFETVYGKSQTEGNLGLCFQEKESDPVLLVSGEKRLRREGGQQEKMNQGQHCGPCLGTAYLEHQGNDGLFKQKSSQFQCTC